MATTGIRRLRGEEYPFGGGDAEPARFDELFDERDAVAAAEFRKRLRQAEDKRRQCRAGVRSYPPPQDSLDLHGMTAQEAEDRSRGFVNSAISRGLLTVRIITGKGLHSPGGKAVLPDVVEQLLVVLKKDQLICTFQWDKKIKERSGSLLVYL